MRIILIIFIVSLIPLSAMAQSDTTSAQGEVVSGEIVIEKDNKIILPQADKIYLKSSPRYFGDQSLQVNFLSNEPLFEWPDYKSDVPFQTIKEPYPLEGFQNYVKAGFGNYSSPLIEAGLFGRLGSFNTQAKLYYESFNSGPVNDGNSASADGGFAFTGTYLKENISVTPSISFNNSRYSFFGNGDRINTGFPDGEVVDVSLNDFQFDIELAGGKEDISYSVKPSFANVNQKLQGYGSLNKETVLGAEADLSYVIDDEFTTGLSLELKNASYDGGIQLDRSLANIEPWLEYSKENLSIQAGFMISSAKVGDNSQTGFYPRARLDYKLSDDWSAYGLISGGQEWIDFGSLTSENEFLDDSLTIVPSEIKSQFGGGIKGSPTKGVLLDANLNYSSIEGLPFFISSSSDSSRFILAYDTDPVGVLTLNTSLSYMPTTVNTYGFSLELNSYSVESLDRPWHKPAYVVKAFTSHNIKEKLIVSAYISSMGGIRGPANVDFGEVKLPAFTDIGLSAKYLITPRASAFLSVNNLLNDEYERYLGYPTRGITFKLGGQYRF